jgi:predicted transcriptional regulator
MTAVPSKPDLLTFAAQIVSAHVAHNVVEPEALPAVIQSVYDTLSGLAAGAHPVAKPVPAVPVNKSVFPDHIVCLEDGKKLKMLKRHIQTAYNMTPEQYRERWDLPRDYPMTAPKYAAHRSALAKTAGLGRKAGKPEAPATAETPPLPPVQKVSEGAKSRGARKKRAITGPGQLT